jgi:hypothetical protein
MARGARDHRLTAGAPSADGMLYELFILPA